MIDPPSSMSGAAARETAINEYTLTSMRDAEAFAGGVDELALQFFRGSVSDRVHKRMQLAVALVERGEEAADLLVFRHVAHVGFGAGQGQDQILRFLFQALVLVGDGQLHAGGVQSLGDGPRDGTLVGDSENYGVTALQVCRHGCSLGMGKNNSRRR